MLRPTVLRRSRPAPTVALGLAAVLVTGVSSGCSFRMVRPAPAREDWPARGSGPASELPCTSSPAPPLIDLALGLGLGTLGFVERDSGTATVALGTALLSLPFFASSIYGAYNVNNCRRYQSAVIDASTPAP
jgi:hypothetical protein